MAKPQVTSGAALVDALFERVTEGLCLVAPDGAVARVNAAWLRWAGLPEDQVVGADAGAVLPGPRDLVRERLARARAGQRVELPRHARVLDGRETWWEGSIEPVPGEDGTWLLVLARAVPGDGEGRRAEDALRESEARFRLALRSAPVSVAAQDRELRYVWAFNQRSVPAGSVIGKRDEDIFTPGEAAHFTALKRRVLEEGIELREQRWVERPGGPMYLDIWWEPVRDEAGRIVGVASATVDLTPHRRAEEALRASEQALRASEEKFSKAFHGSASAMSITRLRDGRFIDVNQRFLELIGATSRDELIGRTSLEMLVWKHPEQREGFVQRLRTYGFVRDEEIVFRRRTGEELTGIVRSQLSTLDGEEVVLTSSYDITELKRANEELRAVNGRLREAVHALEGALEVTRKTEEKLRQAMKMEAVGQLAGGVAHDFNNLLTVILGNSAALLDGLHEADPGREEVAEIQRAGERAAALTHQLLAFSRKQVLEPRVVDVNALLAGLEKMVRRLIGEDIEIALLLEPKVHRCRIDPGQFEQALVNLVVNARDAMREGGRLTIETANVHLDASYVEDHPEAKMGDHVRVTVSDTGVGMTKEIQERLFEPFFTTKGTGRGTGLGLATVYGIVHQSGGTVWVYSEPGQGSTFKLFFPAVEQAQVDAVAPARTSRLLPVGKETILLAEDDQQVRNTISAMLRRAGYVLLEAANGGEALLLCEQHGGRIDLLLTDVVMPKLNGRKVAERLRALRPGLRVLFMSGYTEDAIVHHGVLDDGLDFIAKPVTRDALLTKVREVLDRAEPGAARAGAAGARAGQGE